MKVLLSKKRVYNHLFRHSRITDLAQYLTESQMKEHLGWTQSPKMAATDSAGAQSVCTVKVCVPHDQGVGYVFIDDGQLYDATGIN